MKQLAIIISKEHKEFIALYGVYFLREKVDEQLLDAVEYSAPNGMTYFDNNYFSFIHNDEKNKIHWEVEFEAYPDGFALINFEKRTLN